MAQPDTPAATPVLDVAALQAILSSVLADWVKALNLQVLEARVGEVALARSTTYALL